ncbi:hypothetical protein CWO27_08170 [Vibrio sp. 10N.286.51.C3]|uniref:hypothetical protein n=1 Tax=Vibrio TaxID=662 RepID=UPI000D38436E|nr:MULTISPECIES: hypothetical protein [Vibrio]MCG9562486.1 hypothetical protein [Vibrio chagasii]PTP15130.1 hypothetical protein CWO27_08170 [Vibrio sp. 10N.286.51.C3]TKE73425.1 hypothetical protein FCV45_04080 [Vibrio sp. F12]CAK3652177.1 SMODS and SLOG-associating 2TM effector domain-containing protein [Vibrio crassostreae]
MSPTEIPKEILEAFKVPVLFKIIAWSFTILICALGVYASFHWGDWIHFARAGAVIVVLSLALEASGYIDKYLDKILNMINDIFPEIVLKQVMKNKHMYGLKGNESKDQLVQIARKENSRRLTDIGNIASNQFYKNLRRTEFTIATIGTLIWGFGDLLEALIPLSV